MKKSIIIVSILLCLGSMLSAQDLALYSLNDLGHWNIGKDVGFTSFSEAYTGMYPDSLVIPNMQNRTKEEMQYTILTSEYRNQFLSGAKISGTDSLFIYDYSTDALASFQVKDLKVVACLTLYAHPDDCPCPEYYYMVGFEIDKSLLRGFSDYYHNTLVYAGKENPFVRGEMKPIIWERIEPTDFPFEKADPEIIADMSRETNLVMGKTFIYESADFKYYVQDWIDADYNKNLSEMYQIGSRYLLVIDSKSGEKVIEVDFYRSEGITLFPLYTGETDTDWGEIQWTGMLFKDEPPVVSEFNYNSFGCPYFIFLSPDKKWLGIRCDNRH